MQQHSDVAPQSASSELPEALLKPKRMQDSYVELYLPFTEDPELLEKYIATSGLIRLGKVLEDLDSLAGGISYRHALGGRPGEVSAPIYIVTASVDRLDLLAPLTADANYRLSGHVIYVGSSSMEVFVSIEQLTEPIRPNKICLTGRFTMAARNVHTLSSQRIAPLLLETDAEKALFAMGQSHKNRKRTEAASSLEKVPPSKEEAFLLHSQYIRGLHAGMFATDELHGPALKAEPVEDSDGQTLVPVRKTSLSTTMHMHPQQRNVHQKIFGGFLMRSAYELAWMVSGESSPDARFSVNSLLTPCSLSLYLSHACSFICQSTCPILVPRRAVLPRPCPHRSHASAFLSDCLHFCTRTAPARSHHRRRHRPCRGGRPRNGRTQKEQYCKCGVSVLLLFIS